MTDEEFVKNIAERLNICACHYCEECEFINYAPPYCKDKMIAVFGHMFRERFGGGERGKE